MVPQLCSCLLWPLGVAHYFIALFLGLVEVWGKKGKENVQKDSFFQGAFPWVIRYVIWETSKTGDNKKPKLQNKKKNNVFAGSVATPRICPAGSWKSVAPSFGVELHLHSPEI